MFNASFKINHEFMKMTQNVNSSFPFENWTFQLKEMGKKETEEYLQWPWLISPTSSSFLLSFTNGTKNVTDTNPPKPYGRDEELAKIEMAVLSLLFSLTVLGNIVVLLGIFFRRQKMTRMYYFILHLSVADLITAFFNVLTQLFWEITYRFHGGNILCKIVKYTQIFGPYSSSYILVMTALDRQQAICYPLSNCTWTAKRSKIMLGIAWSISLIFCIPQLFIFSYRQVSIDPPEYDCWGDFPTAWAPKAYVTWYSITVFIIPLIILVFAYGRIIRTIWINFNMKSASRNHDNFETRLPRKGSDEEHSSYVHSQDETCFQGDNGYTMASYGNNNLCLPSKVFLRSERGKLRALISSTCTKQSSTLSPSLNGRRMSEDVTKNSISIFDEEQLHLIPRESMKNGNVKFSEISTNTRDKSRCPSSANCGSIKKKWSNSRRRRRGRGESVSVGNVTRRQSRKASSVATYVGQHPRTHSVKVISRAKIKTIKLTVTIICCYIFCSSPFIAAQLWSVYDPDATESAFFSGPIFTILTLLASLNSCVNPFIFLFFNPNLLENCFRGVFPPKFTSSRFNNNSNSSPLSCTLTQKKKSQLGVGINGTINLTGNNVTCAGLRRSGSTRKNSLPPVAPHPGPDLHNSCENGPGTLNGEPNETIPNMNMVELVLSTLATPANAVKVTTRKQTTYFPVQSTESTVNGYVGGSMSTLIL